MSTETRTSRWNELRAAAILHNLLSLEDALSAEHTGDTEDLDIRVFRDDLLIGVGEVKTDVDPNTAASRDALSKHGATTVALPLNSGQWGLSFRHSANVKRLQKSVGAVVALTIQHGFEFVSPESLWDEIHAELRTSLEKLGIAYLWRQEGSLNDQVILLQEPVGGLVPDECPPLQGLIDEVLSNHETKRSFEILSSALELDQRHLIICLDSNSPVAVQLYSMHHAVDLPTEKVSIPSWVTDLWIILPRAFQEGDVAWRFSRSKGWGLFAPGRFLDF